MCSSDEELEPTEGKLNIRNVMLSLSCELFPFCYIKVEEKTFNLFSKQDTGLTLNKSPDSFILKKHTCHLEYPKMHQLCVKAVMMSFHPGSLCSSVFAQ